MTKSENKNQLQHKQELNQKIMGLMNTGNSISKSNIMVTSRHAF